MTRLSLPVLVQVLDRATRRPVANARVAAFSVSGEPLSGLSSSGQPGTGRDAPQTDDDGQIRLELDRALLSSACGEEPAENTATIVLAVAQQSYAPFQQRRRIQLHSPIIPSLTVELSRLGADVGGSAASARVDGWVRHVTRRPLPPFQVLLKERRLEGDQELAAGELDEHGRFSIQYEWPGSVGGGGRGDRPGSGPRERSEGGGRGDRAVTPDDFSAGAVPQASLDLLVELRNQDGQEVIAEYLLIDASFHDSVEIVIDAPVAPVAEVDQVTRILKPLAAESADNDSDELKPRDLRFLAAKSGLGEKCVLSWHRAVRAKARLGLRPDLGYVLAQHNLDLSTDGLSNASAEIRATLSDAMEAGSIQATSVDDLLEDVAAAVVRAVETADDAEAFENPALRLIVHSNLDSEARQAAARQLFHHGSLDANGLSEALGEAAGPLLRNIGLHDLSLGHWPLLRVLEEGVEPADDPTDLSTVARWSQDEWLDVLQSEVDDERLEIPTAFYPPEEGDSAGEIEEGDGDEDADPDEEARWNFATVLRRRVELRYPSVAVLSRIADAESEGVLASLLEVGLTPQLSRDRVENWISAHADRLGDTNIEELTAELKSVQRLFRLAPSVERARSVLALRQAGFGSARAIASHSYERFKSVMPDDLPESDVAGIYRGAARRAAAADGLVAATHSALDAFLPAAVPSRTPDDADLPDWASLFGSADYCACEHCRSVFSPAAYLVDVLHFLEGSVFHADTGHDGLTALRNRRPDITRIELDCHNTHTPLPAIDLVNEALEALLVPSSLPDGGRQTTWSAEMLRAVPQHVAHTAYQPLRQSLAGRSLPFDWNELQVSGLLSLLNSQRDVLIPLVHPRDDSSERARTAERTVARLTLGLSASEWSLIAGGPDDTELREVWRLFSPAFSSGPTANFSSGPGGVRLALQQGELRWEELESLLSADYVNPEESLEIVFPDGSCDIDEASTHSFDDDAWARVAHLRRLWDRTGLSPYELDVLLTAVSGVAGPYPGDRALGDDVLLALADAVWLQRELRLPADELASWWSLIPTRVQDRTGSDEHSLHWRLFQDPALAEAPDAFAPAALDANGLVAEAHLHQLRAAFGLSDESLRLLLSATGLPDQNGSIDRTGLATLFRHTSLARALGIHVETLLAWSLVTGIAPFPNPSGTRAFISAVESSRARDLEPHWLAYVLHSTPDDAADGVDTALLAIWNAQQDLDASDAAAATVQVLAEHTGASEVALHKLLELSHSADRTLLDVLLEEAFVQGSEPTVGTSGQGDHEDQVASLGLLFRLTELVAALDLQSHALDFWLVHAVELSWLEPTSLMDPPSDPRTRWAAFNALLQGVELSRAATDGQEFLQFLLAAPNQPLEDSLAALAELFAVDSETLKLLAGADGMGLAPADLRSPNVIDRLLRAAEWVERLGGTAELALALSEDELEDGTVSDLRDAVRSQFSDEEWLQRLTPISDAQREARREALTSYLLGRGAEDGTRFEDAADISAHVLTDVEVSACVLTSRIKQATGAAQQLIQRVQLGLEPELEQVDNDRWSWMKRYRVWEANQKIFLYPENWLEPGLRKEISPLFDDASAQLTQVLPTDDTAGQVWLRYLQGLEDVAQIEVLATWYHEAPNAEDRVLHVFGRTTAEPRQYLYRRWEADGVWTPWESIDADVSGTQLIPWFEKGRLFLFWPKYTEGSFEAEDPNSSQETREIPYWSIQLGWTEYRDGSWSQTRISDGAISTAHVRKGSLWFVAVRAVERDFKSGRRSRIRYEDGALKIVVHHAHSLRGERSLFGAFRMDPCRGLLTADPREHWQTSAINWHTQHGVRLSAPELFPAVGSDRVAPNLGRANHYFSEQHSEPRFIDSRDPAHLFGLPGYYEDPWLYDSEVPPFFYQDSQRTFFGRARQVFIKREDRRELPGLRLSSERLWLETRGDNPVTDGLSLSTLPHRGAPGPQLDAAAPDSLTLGTSRRDFERLEDVDGTTRLMAKMIRTTSTSTSAPSSSPRPPVSLGRKLVGRTTPSLQDPRVDFDTFYHPWACHLLELISQYGLDAALWPDPDRPAEAPWWRQRKRNEFFASEYQPTRWVHSDYPVDSVQFGLQQSYGVYNTELFLHLPRMLASALTAAGEFEAAQRWLHVIFDPMRGLGIPDDSHVESPWQLGAFDGVDSMVGIVDLLRADAGDSSAVSPNALDGIRAQIARWNRRPFDPDAIADLRPVAYQKAVVMQYLDNLLAWADHLFRQDSIESLNEAMQLYTLAAELLGERPEQIEKPDTVHRSFDELEEDLGQLGNALVELENDLPETGESGTSDTHGSRNTPSPIRFTGQSLYFCVPPNPKLLSCWDLVEDRLFKIRHCLDIEGRRRTLPLFEPPIPPGRLLAAGPGNFSGALAAAHGSTGPYRFRTVLGRARSLTASVVSYGDRLLNALERRDAEQLSLLLRNQDREMAALARGVLEQRVEAAKLEVDVLQETRLLSEQRRDELAGREYMNQREERQRDQLGSAFAAELAAQALQLLEGVMGGVPDVYAGGAGVSSPVLLAGTGGSSLRALARAATGAARMVSSIFRHQANIAGILGTYDRRQEEWDFQVAQEEQRLEEIDARILAAEQRVHIAEQELANHQTRMAQLDELANLLKDRFTNAELYQWMTSRLSGLHRTAYNLAVDMARVAEASFRFELGELDASFIGVDHWNEGRRGLLAGLQLQQELERLEAAYQQRNRRRLAISKNISLALVAPESLRELRHTGQCTVELPEALFDLDYPGHYQRRIQSVRVTVPAVLPPDSGVNCTLTLTRNRTRMTSELVNGQYADQGTNDPRFQDDFGAVQSIVTSHGEQDAGVFADGEDRYLPFEGAGAISTWRVELDPRHNHFDVRTLSDVVLHIDYTALDGGEPLREAARVALQDALTQRPQRRIFSLRHEFSDGWHQFFHPDTSAEPDASASDGASDGPGSQRLPFALDLERWPALIRQLTITPTSFALVAVLKDELNLEPDLPLRLLPPGFDEGSAPLPDAVVLRSQSGVLGGAPFAQTPVPGLVPGRSGTWRLAVTSDDLTALPDELVSSETIDGVTYRTLKESGFEDIVLLCTYELS